jgi:hypothetical protein
VPSDSDVEFGQIAVRHKLITRKQHDEAFKVLKKLEGSLKRKGKLKKKRPRLVDVLVQKDMISGSEAKSVENARKFRQIRLDDKLYARIALKSKFCSQDDIQDALDKQKKRYLGGKSPKRLAEFLLSKGTLSDEEDEAIQEAIAKLDAREYVARDRGRSSEGSDIDLDDEDGSDVEELEDDSDVEEIDDDSDLEEIDDDDLEEVDVEELSGSGIDLDIDDDESVESLENDSEVAELDSDIDVRLSGLEGDIDDLSDVGDVDARDDTKSPPPRGLSSDLDLDDDLGLADDDDDDDAIDLDDDDDDDDDDSDDLDLDDDDGDDDDDDDDDSFGSDIDDIDLDDLD